MSAIILLNVTVVTYRCYRVVAPGSYNTKPLHHSVLHQSLSVRLQGLDGDVLGTETHTPAKHYSSVNVMFHSLFIDRSKRAKR